uniref:Uncharacterized protein n=2 Tax=Phaeomonas parva TaxID=124430 RepID=A0A7S1XXS8_9STRA|mmetsp:Transcript_42946/g.134760  ORF Transcript_42946/g.134760 Transcript_42946/m.134760 type:complete len:101 (+) Transcript_42946:799-1101(+)
MEVPKPGTWAKHEWNENHYSVLGDVMWYDLLHRAGFVDVDFWEFDVTPAPEQKQRMGIPEDFHDGYYAFLARKNSSAPKPTYKSAMKVVSLPFEGAPEGT